MSGGWIVKCDGESVLMPLDGEWIVPDLEGELPNRAVLVMDEGRFKRGFEQRAIWCHGVGEYASLAYCGEGLTIQRYYTLAKAIEAKRAIDSCGCGGECVNVHLILRVDPTNSRKACQEENVRAYVRQNKAP
jgi:hypothetical protein